MPFRALEVSSERRGRLQLNGLLPAQPPTSKRRAYMCAISPAKATHDQHLVDSDPAKVRCDMAVEVAAGRNDQLMAYFARRGTRAWQA